MSSIATTFASVNTSWESAGAASVPAGRAQTREAFQDFVAGTFYKQMLKAMRSSQSEVQYLGGSQGEKIFQSQLDQHLAETLAREQGAAFAEPLFSSFENYLDARA